ncbi:major facilitator transporter [Arthrobacter crystallopoietes BAB-32]|uniref:Major facilitator transporter n=1 Tax=Arthrobacter crystallopoietes BAB-32 TaxID=1246476 RepID=N1UWB3_9MICC|nr:MFS transporter [Arthrobacter crystallopoietes]EMY34686.1 major facilitator transporter [Arthrobacter crystallopoietes BAB-32]
MNEHFEPGIPAQTDAGDRPSGTAEADARGGNPRKTWGRYARLAELAGLSFLAIGFPARLPLAMLTIGALTMVTASTGSYALGGFAAGAVGLGSALGAPLLGYLADRNGQRPVLLLSAAVHTIAVALLLLAVYASPADAGMPAVLAASLAVGASCPQVSPMARVRWMALARHDKRALDTALSYESTADELTFVLGPALVGLLAATVAPWLPFALVVLLTVTLVPAFALHRTVFTVAPIGRKMERRHPAAVAAARSRPPVNWLYTSVPVLGMVAMGMFFGSTQNALSAFGGTFGAADSAGLLYALLGLTSAFGALSVAYWPARWNHAARWIVCGGTMAVFTALLQLPTEVAPMILILLLVGLPVGPTMVTIFSIGTVVAPKNRLGTVMTLLASGVVLGSALGSAAAGAVAESAGYSAAFIVSLGAAAALFVLGFLAAVVRRKATAVDQP